MVSYKYSLMVPCNKEMDDLYALSDMRRNSTFRGRGTPRGPSLPALYRDAST